MELFEAIEKRGSYRGRFEDRPVPREHLKKIVEAGIRAPSGCNMQPVDFIIVDDRATVDAMAAIMDHGTVKGAPAAIVCVIDARQKNEGFSYAVEDCSASTENMLLAITALGYATVWIDGNLRFDRKGERVAKLLNVPAGKQVRIVLPLGVPAQPVTQAEKKSFGERAWFNKYGTADGRG
jgi:nitroreductase